MTNVTNNGVVLQHLEYLTGYNVFATGGCDDDISTWGSFFNRSYFVA